MKTYNVQLTEAQIEALLGVKMWGIDIGLDISAALDLMEAARQTSEGAATGIRDEELSTERRCLVMLFTKLRWQADHGGSPGVIYPTDFPNLTRLEVKALLSTLGKFVKIQEGEIEEDGRTFYVYRVSGVDDVNDLRITPEAWADKMLSSKK